MVDPKCKSFQERPPGKQVTEKNMQWTGVHCNGVLNDHVIFVCIFSSKQGTRFLEVASKISGEEPDERHSSPHGEVMERCPQELCCGLLVHGRQCHFLCQSCFLLSLSLWRRRSLRAVLRASWWSSTTSLARCGPAGWDWLGFTHFRGTRPSTLSPSWPGIMWGCPSGTWEWL